MSFMKRSPKADRVGNALGRACWVCVCASEVVLICRFESDNTYLNVYGNPKLIKKYSICPLMFKIYAL